MQLNEDRENGCVWNAKENRESVIVPNSMIAKDLENACEKGGVTGEFSPVEGVVAYRVEGDARRRGRLPPPSQTECGFK